MFLRCIQQGRLNSFVNSYKQSLYNYYNCILDNTLECIQDLAPNNSNYMILRYFCGDVIINKLLRFPPFLLFHYVTFLFLFGPTHLLLRCSPSSLLIASPSLELLAPLFIPSHSRSVVNCVTSPCSVNSL